LGLQITDRSFLLFLKKDRSPQLNVGAIALFVENVFAGKSDRYSIEN
jgi:hypothetical protein